jgi:hypothetical protein
MPNATISTVYSSAAPTTQASLTTEISNAMQAAGFSAPFDVVTGATNYLVFKQTFDSTKTKGRVFLVVAITSDLKINQALYDSWDASAHAGSNGGAGSNIVGFIPSNSLTYTSINHPEVRGVMMYAVDGNTLFLGYFRPASKPTWWDEDKWVYCFQPNDPNFLAFYPIHSSVQPYGNRQNIFHSYIILANSGFRVRDLVYPNRPASVTGLRFLNPSGKRDVVGGITVYAPSDDFAGNFGVSGITTTDLAQTCGEGLRRLDILKVTPGVLEYLLLAPITNGLAVRIV